MDMSVTFPVSGVTTWVFLPPLVAFAVSFVTSMGGVSGAFLLLPFQITFLNFVSPSVSATNFVYNVVAIPSGVYRYVRERRMVWPLAWTIILGTIPGVFIGYLIRVRYLPSPRDFRLFVGCVLLYTGVRIAREVFLPVKGVARSVSPDCREVVDNGSFSLSKVKYDFRGESFCFGVPRMLSLAFIVGIVGGAYGIGGGSIIAPFCISFFGLPVYTVAGAALLGTFVTSIAGVLFYSLVPAQAGLSTLPDWPLGILFGLGGILGMYCGARLQRHVSQRLIKGMLAVMLLSLSISYLIGVGPRQI